MARRKPSPLVQAIAAFNALDEKDRATLADYIRTQMPRTTKAKKNKKAEASNITDLTTKGATA
jgi:mono/diheme cytochrome c family protein